MVYLRPGTEFVLSHLPCRKFVSRAIKNPVQGLELEIRSYRLSALYEESGP